MVDTPKSLFRKVERAIEAINSECAQLTEGRVTAPGSQVARLMAWLASEGTALTDVSRETVGVALDARHPAVVHRVLELRQQAAKSSVAKLERMIDVASNKDGRARHLLQFYGAGRTGRWAGTTSSCCAGSAPRSACR